MKTIVLLLLSSLLISCSNTAMVDIGYGPMPAEKHKPKARMHFDTPPQTIYQIDKSRFVTLENYENCYKGDVYYNDTQEGVRTRIDWTDETKLTYASGLGYFPGKLIIDSKHGFIAFAGSHAAIPSEHHDLARLCTDRGCNLKIRYSIDKGKTFQGFTIYNVGFNSSPGQLYRDLSKYKIVLKDNWIYINDGTVTNRIHIPNRVPNDPDIDVTDVTLPEEAKTPSGQDHMNCDNSIKPRSAKIEK